MQRKPFENISIIRKKIPKGGGFKKVAGATLATLGILGAAGLVGTDAATALAGAVPLVGTGALLIASDKK